MLETLIPCISFYSVDRAMAWSFHFCAWTYILAKVLILAHSHIKESHYIRCTHYGRRIICITTGRMYLLAALLRKSSWLDPYASIFMCLETYRPLRIFFLWNTCSPISVSFKSTFWRDCAAIPYIIIATECGWTFVGKHETFRLSTSFSFRFSFL